MQRTTLYSKNNKVYLQREFRVGEGVWQPVTRLAGDSVATLVKRYPIYFPSGKIEVMGESPDETVSRDK
jgi:hypothetical protein